MNLPLFLQDSRTPIRYDSWPESLRRPEARRYLATVASGCLQLQATDGHARVQLAPHAQSVIACYLTDMAATNGTSAERGEEDRSRLTHCCSSTLEVHSVLAVPEHWRHPVSLLLQESRLERSQRKQDGMQTTLSPSHPARSSLELTTHTHTHTHTHTR